MVAATAERASAQVIAEPAPPPWPDPKKFAKGPFASGEVGALAYLGRAGKYTSPGVAFGVRLGYDLFRWLSLQGVVTASISNATTPPPTNGQDFELFLYAAVGRLQLQIRRFGLFAEGGAGVAQITSNVLDAPGVTNGRSLSFTVVAGGGLDFHTLNRHFSLGVSADYLLFTQFTGGHAVDVWAFLKYTR